MSTYESMKETGITWMGKIPSHWRVEKAKLNFTQTNGRGNSNPVLLAASQKYGMCPQSLLDGVVKVSENTDLQTFKTVHRNDFVISLRSFQGGFERSDYEGVCSPAYQVFTYNHLSYNADYLKYLFKNEMFIDEINSLTVGIREGKNIKFDDFANSLLFVPPLNEQIAIGAYLKEHCEKIESIIEEAKSSIVEYKQWKSSLIFEATTKGLDPNIKMKDSGVEWVGEIPNNWAFIPLKQIVTRRNGGSWGDEPKNDENTRVCMRIADFAFDSGRFKHVPCSELTVRNYNANQIDKLTLSNGDICIEKSGGGEKTPVGRAVLYDLDVPALFANFMERISVDQELVMPEFAEYYLRAMYSKAVTAAYIKQTTGLQNLNISSLLEKEYIVLPDIEVQGDIVVYLDSICSDIDNLTGVKTKLIKELESYKSSLIYEVVTGKRKVV